MTDRPLFVRVADGVMVNTNKLLSLKYYPKIESGVFRQDEHYKAVFEGSDRELWLKPEEGKALMTYISIGVVEEVARRL